jgi:hypothetical protein
MSAQDPIDGELEALPNRPIRGEAPEGVVGSGPKWNLRDDGPSSEFILALLFVVVVAVLAFLLSLRRRGRR